MSEIRSNDKKTDEQLSALMDGELAADELGALLDAMERDPMLRQQWADHHQLREVLFERGEQQTPSEDFSSRVMALVDREPTILAPRGGGREDLVNEEAVKSKPSAAAITPPSRRPWVPVALAASLALFSFLLVQQNGLLQSSEGVIQQAAVAPAVTTEWVEVDGEWVERWVNPQDQDISVGSYLIRHREQGRADGALVSTAPSQQGREAVKPVTRRIIGWKPGWMPEGYRQIDTLEHQIPTFGGAVTHLVLSDGDALFSIFIDKSSAREGERLMEREGEPTSLYSFTRLGYRITVLGDASIEVVRRVAQAMEPERG